MKSERIWYAILLTIEPPALEAAEYALMEAGALGTQVTDEGTDEFARLLAYFDHTPEREKLREALFEALRVYDLPTSSVREMELSEVEDRDWLGEWKRNWQPVEVGSRFIIAPPWSELPETPERIIIRIEPGMAFGTGTHETTRLCLTAIEKYFVGQSFLDVGTGTGILAIAVAKLYSMVRVEACDVDAEAIEIARENAHSNGVGERIIFRTGSVDESYASADTVCANLTADAIIPLLPALLSLTCGRLILSGILDSQASLVRSRLKELAVAAEPEIMTDGEWVAVIV